MQHPICWEQILVSFMFQYALFYCMEQFVYMFTSFDLVSFRELFHDIQPGVHLFPLETVAP